MVRIRLRRVGSRNQPSFRIVAADRESPRDGKFLEILGHYNPRTEPSTIQIDEARLFHWLQNGAQPSDSVVDALRSIGTWERWERFKGGEKLEKLLKEAEAAIPQVDPRTRRDDLAEKRVSKKSKKKQKEASEEPAKEKPAKKAKAEKTESEAEEAVEVAEEAVEAAEEAVEAAEEKAEAETEEPKAEEEKEESDEKDEASEE